MTGMSKVEKIIKEITDCDEIDIMEFNFAECFMVLREMESALDEERNGMQTDEQKKAEGIRFDEYEKTKKKNDLESKLYKMPDQKLLIELAIAYGNTEDADLGSYHRRNVLAIFSDLNLDHVSDCPCPAKERSDT